MNKWDVVGYAFGDDPKGNSDRFGTYCNGCIDAVVTAETHSWPSPEEVYFCQLEDDEQCDSCGRYLS